MNKCPIGGEHFATRAEAKASLEVAEAAAHDTVPAGKKKPVSYITHRQREASALALTATMASRANTHQPGCSGCSDEFGDGHGDYCRCTEYDGTFESVEPSELALALRGDLQADLDPGLSSLTELVVKHELHDGANYYPEAYSDYYGEVLDHVRLTTEGNSRLDALLEDLRSATVPPTE